MKTIAKDVSCYVAQWITNQVEAAASAGNSTKIQEQHNINLPRPPTDATAWEIVPQVPASNAK